MKICITGGAGFIGDALAGRFARQGHEVLVLDLAPPGSAGERVSFIRVDLMRDQVPDQVLACDALVHLAGANIFGRWTENYKRLILDSRVKSARALIGAVKGAGHGPKVFVTASAIGYYGEGGERELGESAPPGSDFLAGVCREWEGVAPLAEEAGMRFVAVRTGIVMGPGGGMLAKIVPIFRWGLGGPLGSGRQWFSWIHRDDLLEIYALAVSDERLRGPVNAVSPYPVRNREFARILGRTLGRPAFIPVPGFVLRLVLGELAGAVTMSQRVVPTELSRLNFAYGHPRLESAL